MNPRQQFLRHRNGLVNTHGIAPWDAEALMKRIRVKSDSEGITDLNIIMKRQELAYRAYLELEPKQIDHIIDLIS